MSDVGCQILDVGFKMLDVGFRMTGISWLTKKFILGSYLWANKKTMTMKFIYCGLLQLVFVLTCLGQEYGVNQFQTSYDTLVDFTSASLEEAELNEGSVDWVDIIYDFGFEFPFFGETFTQLESSSHEHYIFPDESSGCVDLFSFEYAIEKYHVELDFLNSDVRYAQSTSNFGKVLIIEYHNVFHGDEYWDNEDNHYLNFQHRFYENGIVEIRFGDIDLTNNTHYIPGLGFSENPNDAEDINAPWVFMGLDQDNYICFAGDHTNPTIIRPPEDPDESFSVMSSIPPEGHVIQFVPDGVSVIQEVPAAKQFWLEEEDGRVEIKGALEAYTSCAVFDIMGKEIMSSKETQFQIEQGARQVYVFVITKDQGKEVHKVLVGK